MKIAILCDRESYTKSIDYFRVSSGTITYNGEGYSYYSAVNLTDTYFCYCFTFYEEVPKIKVEDKLSFSKVIFENSNINNNMSYYYEDMEYDLEFIKQLLTSRNFRYVSTE